MTAIALSPEGDAILTGCEDGSGRLGTWPPKKSLWTFQSAGRVVAVGFQVRINAIAILSADRVVRLLPRCSAIGDDPESILLRAKLHTGMELDQNDHRANSAVRSVKSSPTSSTGCPQARVLLANRDSFEHSRKGP